MILSIQLAIRPFSNYKTKNHTLLEFSIWSKFQNYDPHHYYAFILLIQGEERI